MSWQEFVLAVTASLAWPVAILVMLIALFKWDGWVARYRFWQEKRRLRKTLPRFQREVQDRLFGNLTAGLDAAEIRACLTRIEEIFGR